MPDKQIRILHVIETLETGGAERVLASIVNGLPRDSFSSFVCCTKNTGSVAKDISNVAGPIIELHRNSGNSYKTACLMAAVLRKLRIDLVHGHNWSTFCETVLGGYIAGTKTIVNTIHGLQAPSPVTARESAKRLVRTAAERVLARLSNQICSVSNKVREDVLRSTSLSPNKVTVVYNGIDIPAGEPVASPSADETGVRHPELVLCWAGRMAPVKHLSLLLEAVALINDRIPLTLILVGDGPERTPLESKVKELRINNSVNFVGYSHEVNRWLRSADIFVMPSHYEGFSVALLEAMAAGLPVIATAVGGNPEIVLNGCTGILVPPNDPSSLAAAILDLHHHSDNRRKMGTAGRDRVSSEFSMDRMVSQYIRIYREHI
jgi:L-malate glycosyltransferase